MSNTLRTIFDLFTKTWDAGAGVTQYGLRMDLTDTASAAASAPIEVRVGGASKFNVNKTGDVLIPLGRVYSCYTTGYGFTTASGGHLRLITGGDMELSTGPAVAGVFSWNPTTGQSVITGPTLTGSSATSLVSATQTWNTTGVPTALKVSVTNTASGAGSKVCDFQVGGTTILGATTTHAQFGTHTAIGAETVTGYVTIVDAAGTQRKLAVVS